MGELVRLCLLVPQAVTGHFCYRVHVLCGQGLTTQQVIPSALTAYSYLDIIKFL